MSFSRASDAGPDTSLKYERDEDGWYLVQTKEEEEIEVEPPFTRCCLPIAHEGQHMFIFTARISGLGECQSQPADEPDEETGCTPAEMAVPAGMTRRYAFVPTGSVTWLEAIPAAECVQGGSEKKTVQGDREIRQGAVCCAEVA